MYAYITCFSALSTVYNFPKKKKKSEEKYLESCLRKANLMLDVEFKLAYTS